MKRCSSCLRLYKVVDLTCPFCCAPSRRSRNLTKAAGMILTPAILSACYGVPGMYPDPNGDSGNLDDSTSPDTSSDITPVAIAVSWEETSVSITIENGAGGYWLGVAETTSACGEDCWTGEDCVWGYELEDGSVVGPYCHDAGDSGTQLEYGGDPLDLQTGTTVFTSEYEDDVTWYVESDPEFGGDGTCWIWGHDPSYYAGMGCTEIE